MIRLLQKLILLFIAFVIIDYIIGLGLNIILNNSPDGRYFKALYSLEKSNEDIVIFGASCAETNIVPYVFEDSLKMTCWNSGRGGQLLPFFICIEQGMLNRYVPKIAVIDMGVEDLETDLSEFYEKAGFLSPFYRKHKEIRPILNKISFFERYFMYSMLYAYNSSYYYLLRPYLFRGLDGKRGDKGWKPRTGQMPKIIPNPVIVNTSKKLNNETVSAFNEFVTGLSAKGCKVFVVIHPVFNEITTNTSTIENIKKMKNVDLLDFDDNKLIAENSLFFRDPGHLNIQGAIKFTTLLVNKIRHKINKNTL